VAYGGAPDNAYTWDIPQAKGGPRRAGTADFSGDQIPDGPLAPQKGVEPYSGLFNELIRHAVGANRVLPAVILWVRFTMGQPVIYQFAAMATSDKITGANFTATLTATGQTSIVWDAYDLPNMLGPPGVFNHAAGNAPWGETQTSPPSNKQGVTIYTYAQNGTAANIPFMVLIW
jgi:hypothetical protein